ncbi:DUF6817 domain-containing protein [Streptomyces albidoflavus]|uniref:DUF6817 domain-containing protein n=1 Tax=Streptomyces albidoflavus TaxID=1886 RepID=UPI0033AE6266
MTTPPDAAARATALLRELGAGQLAHPGGSLAAHLQRVHTLLASWNARPALQLAGLCHAFYGTDGFPTALLPLTRRTELATVIGAEAEALVYLYAACDRPATYPRLADPEAPFHDRFTGTATLPARQARRDFTELSAANELDLAAHAPAFRTTHGPDLLALFTGVNSLLSPAAWAHCQELLAGPPPDAPQGPPPSRGVPSAG